MGTCDQDTPTDCAMVLAEDAIEGDGVAECFAHRLLVAADVIMASAEADHRAPSPDTWKLGRADGRTASVYRLPAEVVDR